MKITDQKPRHTLTLVSIGARVLTTGKLGHAYYMMGPDGPVTSKTLIYTGLINPVGSIVEVEAADTEGEHIYPATAKVVNVIDDPEQAEVWHAEDVASRGVVRMRKQQEKLERSIDPIGNALRGIRRVYQASSSEYRAALLARVVHTIIKP